MPPTCEPPTPLSSFIKMDVLTAAPRPPHLGFWQADLSIFLSQLSIVGPLFIMTVCNNCAQKARHVHQMC